MIRLASFALFFSVVLLILAGIHLYFYRRLLRNTDLPSRFRRRATWALVALGVCIPVALPLARVLPSSLSPYALFIPYVWMGMMLYLLFSLLCSDLLRLMVAGLSKLTGPAYLPAWWTQRHRQARLIAVVVLTATAAMTATALHGGLAPPQVRKVRVELARLPQALDGTSIVQLTDLHLGPTLQEDFLADVVKRVNALAPDLVVITGDLVDGPSSRLLPMVAALGDLRATHGVFFVTGNHEFYAGVDDWLPALRKLGIRVLENERLAIEQQGAIFDLAGIHDLQAGRHQEQLVADLSKVLAGRDRERPLILLSHQCRIIDEAEPLGVDLILSGHNHGGQIWPFMYLVRLRQPFLAGLYRRGETQVYVSTGTGFWGPPMRLGTRSEITYLTLHAPAGRPAS